MNNLFAWLAQALPRRLVMACLLRAVNHSRAIDPHRGLIRSPRMS